MEQRVAGRSSALNLFTILSNAPSPLCVRDGEVTGDNVQCCVGRGQLRCAVLARVNARQRRQVGHHTVRQLVLRRCCQRRFGRDPRQWQRRLQAASPAQRNVGVQSVPYNEGLVGAQTVLLAQEGQQPGAALADIEGLPAVCGEYGVEYGGKAGSGWWCGGGWVGWGWGEGVGGPGVPIHQAHAALVTTASTPRLHTHLSVAVSMERTMQPVPGIILPLPAVDGATTAQRRVCRRCRQHIALQPAHAGVGELRLGASPCTQVGSLPSPLSLLQPVHMCSFLLIQHSLLIRTPVPHPCGLPSRGLWPQIGSPAAPAAAQTRGTAWRS